MAEAPLRGSPASPEEQEEEGEEGEAEGEAQPPRSAPGLRARARRAAEGRAAVCVLPRTPGSDQASLCFSSLGRAWGTLASTMAPLWPLVLAAASGILAIDTPHPRSSALHHLTKQLLQKYRKEVRPVHNWTQATTVYLDMFVHAVLDVDTQNQILKTSVWYREVWDDEFLSWNSSMFDEIREISLPLSAIWAPDIIINEFVDTERSPDLPYVYVNSSGTIKHSKPIQVVSACSLETYAFPFDIQNCSLTFNSILHTVEDVDLAFLRSREDITHDQKAFVNDSEWELLSVSSTYNVLQSSAGDFAQIQFNVVIRRRPLVYVVNLLIPSIFLMLVDLGSFYLPPTCRARIMFKTSVLVGYTVFRVNMSDEVPRSAVSTPLIEVFFMVCMAFLVLSLSKSILLVKFLHDERCSRQEQTLLCLRGDTDADRPRLDPQGQLTGVTESPICQEHQAQSGTLKEVWSQLRPISSYFQNQDQEDRQEAGWLALLERFDRLLFQSYLVVLGLYTITLCALWVSWSGL
ncbi:5-hydroxytryptamine receptor 3B [Hippopotamus amphibius kiboko]|uniref:5-hydroxytryptamine receptor 3B n=1 Tax=Hippopotamus amphibius kiboko TaxID=575201 RepID=UPI0025998FE5|nr:5-hydroxytryptamine receptor 3B [Hippopotamus amphibius kiboko]